MPKQALMPLPRRNRTIAHSLALVPLVLLRSHPERCLQDIWNTRELTPDFDQGAWPERSSTRCLGEATCRGLQGTERQLPDRATLVTQASANG